MPHGLKLEKEENISKPKDNSIKSIQKKSKKSIVHLTYNKL